MLLRVYAKLDSSNKIALPRGIRKSMDIKPGDKLELTIMGMNKSRTFLRVSKFTQKGGQVVKEFIPPLRSIEKVRDKAKKLLVTKQRRRYGR